MNKLKWGSYLATAAYSVLLLNTLATHLMAAHNHEMYHQNLQFAAVWPMAAVLSLSLVEIYLCWDPLRRGESWAFWLALVPLVILGLARFAGDSRCFGSLHVHGCHTFLITLVLGFVGLVMAKLGTVEGRTA
jgi:hypothetical protein